jgi:Zn-dependent protease with chaperone function
LLRTAPERLAASQGEIMSAAIVKRLRHHNETLYQVLLSIFSLVFWLIIIFGFVAALARHNAKLETLYAEYGIGIPLFFIISASLYRARAYGNMVLLGPNQCAPLYQAVVDGAAKLGMATPPKIFLYNANGIMNAFARRLLGGRYVFLTSALVEVQNDAQVRFVIGHELGHHAAGHLDVWKMLLTGPGHFVPFLGSAYSRSREYTCDAIGAWLCDDPHAARSSLQMLGCGCGRLNATLNCDEFAAQEEMVPPIAGFVSEIFRSHPRLTRRVRAIGAVEGVRDEAGQPEGASPLPV